MNGMDIARYAQRVVAEIAAVIRRHDAPDKVVIASYTPENYAELNRGPGEMTYDEHMRTIKAVAELLTRAGIADRVVFQDVDASEYWRWLARNRIPDSRPARGMFADLKYHGKTEEHVNGIEQLRNARMPSDT